MDFEFTEDQKMWKDSYREFLERDIVPMVDEQEKKGPVTKEEAIDLLKKFKKIGISYDLESMVELARDFTIFGIMTEEIGRVWPSLLPIIGLSLTEALVPFASDEMRERLLPKVERCELIGCYSITGPEAGLIHLL